MMPGMGRLEGRTALVTGASRGIGRAIALRLAGEGCRVALAARTMGDLEAVAAECGPGALPLRLDVTDDAAIAAVVARCESELGGIDVLVNNAGIADSHKFTDLTDDVWERTLAVNLTAPFHVTRAALPGMLQRGSGAVVMIASIASKVGGAYIAHYAAAKHGLLGMTRSLAAEYVRSGITFNCVCPAYVDTDMTQRSIANIVERTGRTRERALAALLTPQGRLVRPEEVAEVCLLLAVEEGRSINGQAITIDGGAVQA
jgi:NAD(P)-dependent dehydrogenase (short-subunit alcohol dehydrogenase family)